MTGNMRRRQSKFSKAALQESRLLKSFTAPQKDNSVRSKRRAKRNDYTDQSHQERGQ